MNDSPREWLKSANKRMAEVFWGEMVDQIYRNRRSHPNWESQRYRAARGNSRRIRSARGTYRVQYPEVL